MYTYKNTHIYGSSTYGCCLDLGSNLGLQIDNLSLLPNQLPFNFVIWSFKD